MLDKATPLSHNLVSNNRHLSRCGPKKRLIILKLGTVFLNYIYVVTCDVGIP